MMRSRSIARSWAPRTRRKPIRERSARTLRSRSRRIRCTGRILPRMPSGRSAFSSRQSKYAPSLGARFAGLISGRAKRQLAVWFEAGVDTAALLFFPLLVLAPRGVAALASAAGLCAAGLVLLARGFEPRPLFGRTAAVLGCLLVWAMVSVLWSAGPSRPCCVRLGDRDRNDRGDLGTLRYVGESCRCRRSGIRALALPRADPR